MGKDTTVAIVVIAVLCLFATAAVIFVAEGSESVQRLGLLFGLLGTGLASLAAYLKSHQAEMNTNGRLTRRVKEAVAEALAELRSDD